MYATRKQPPCTSLHLVQADSKTIFALADDFAANMRTNMLAAILPGALGIAGTLLFGWGMGICVLLS